MPAWIERIAEDLRYAVRMLRSSPAFSGTVALTFALGIGVNAAIFSVLERLILRPPAGVSNPSSLRRLRIVSTDANARSIAFSPSELESVRHDLKGIATSRASVTHDSGRRQRRK